MTEIRDFRGNEVKVGSRILYAITKSRSACLVEAEVLEIRENESNYGPSHKLHVQPLQDSYGVRWSNARFDREQMRYVADGLPKPVTLQHLDRFAVIA